MTKDEYLIALRRLREDMDAPDGDFGELLEGFNALSSEADGVGDAETAAVVFDVTVALLAFRDSLRGRT